MDNTRTSNPVYASGIKPLNAPRTVHVRTDSAGNPASIQVPPAIDSPRSRRKHGNNSCYIREREQSPKQTTLLSDGKWMLVVDIDDIWKVNDEWWRGANEEIIRLYYVLRLESGQKLTIYLNLTTNIWYRQAG